MKKMVGWGQLKDGLKPALNKGFLFLTIILFPRLFPRFAFGTPVLERIFQRNPKIGGTH